jgi:hypothetical protein
MKPCDLVRWREEYVGEDDWNFYEGKVGMIVSLYEGRSDQVTPIDQLFNILLCGEFVGAFEYELEVVSEAG